MIQQIVEDNPCPIVASLWYGVPRALYVQADISSIKYSVFDTKTNLVVPGHDDQPVTVADVILDTPLTVAVVSDWKYGSLPINFRHTISGTAFPNAPVTYQIEYTITPVVGDPVYLDPFFIRTKERRAG